MSPKLSVFIIVLTTLNVVGAVWLMWSMRRRDSGESGPSAETTGHVWDGDLGEYNNPLPRWWLWMFYISVAFAIGYLALYPGFGNLGNRLGWSSSGELAQQQQVAEAQAQQLMSTFRDKSIEQLRTDPAAHSMGRNLFVNNCANCHGADGHGNVGFPNLADNDWLYGGSPEQIQTTISGGRVGVMIPWGDVLGSDGVENVLAYVLSLSGRSVPAGDLVAGKQIFTTNCVACHGVDGKGSQALGAPNLTDNIWLYGGSVEAIRNSIAHGRQGQMPAQLARLGAERIRVLTAYVLSLGDANSTP